MTIKGGAPPAATPAGRGLSAQSAGDRASTPLLTKESGNAVTNAAADVVDRVAAPFQNLNRPGVSAFAKAQGVVGAVAGLAHAPTDFLNDAFARATDGISKALPSFPAATIGCMVLGMPHTHTHPPSLIPPAPPIPLPAIGAIMTGCPTVLIGGMPAARSGDFGVAPTCGSLSPIFEVFTGSSKVFIGGSRAARMLDITRQCGPASKAGGAAGAMSKMQKASAAAGKVMGGVAKLSMAMGIVGAGLKIVDKHSEAAAAQAAANAAQAAADASDDASDASAAAAADAKAAAATAGAEASAAILAAAMMAADLAVGAAKTAMGNMMGKDPGAPMCIGAVMIGMPVVLIGGFPMPSWTDVAKGLKKLASALGRGRRGGAARGRAFCLECM
jgi:uncharacterized Zn-binding protein involved in type VI secretion